MIVQHYRITINIQFDWSVHSYILIKVNFLQWNVSEITGTMRLLLYSHDNIISIDQGQFNCCQYSSSDFE